MIQVGRHTRNTNIQKLLLCGWQLHKIEIHLNYKSTHCGS